MQTDHDPSTSPIRAIVIAGERPAGHIAVGLGLTAVAVVVSVLVARRAAPQADPEKSRSPAPRVLFGIVWSPIYLALTLSGLRIWNAQPSADRNRALALWGLVQAFNALWMTIGAKRLGGDLTTGVATVGTASIYAWQARKVDTPAATLANPYLGWLGLANVLSGQLGRKGPSPTIH